MFSVPTWNWLVKSRPPQSDNCAYLYWVYKIWQVDRMPLQSFQWGLCWTISTVNLANCHSTIPLPSFMDSLHQFALWICKCECLTFWFINGEGWPAYNFNNQKWALSYKRMARVWIGGNNLLIDSQLKEFGVDVLDKLSSFQVTNFTTSEVCGHFAIDYHVRSIVPSHTWRLVCI